MRFFTPVISFSRGILLENLTLYNIPRSKGKRRIGRVKILSKNPRTSERKKDSTTDNLKINSIFSDVLLLGSKSLIELIDDFKEKVYEFQLSIMSEDNAKTEQIHKGLSILGKKILIQMRKDLELN